jgi:DNA polymerase-3 subunit alpha
VEGIKFVNLHAHDVYSTGDGLGFPDEHFDFAYSNGLDAHAITNHGNMNSLPHMVQHVKKMQAEGKNFKAIFGVEAYFLPSVEEWKEFYDENKQKKKDLKKTKNASYIEDEEETRKAKNIINKRRHLLLLAQNQIGLNNLFRLVSKSFSRENFYRYPRMDYKMLKENNEGIIATSACLGGVYAGCYWENKEEGEEKILTCLRETTEKFLDIFGDRWYAEVQWNGIPEQHELNHYVIQISKEYKIPLITTVDSHYPTPDSWEAREIYKRLAWLGKKKPSWLEKPVPSSVEEIGYELYPKNGDQVWESYKKYSALTENEYDDDLIRESIEAAYHIAHKRIETFLPDATVRLPSFILEEGKDPNETLTRMCIKALKVKKLNRRKGYVERLRTELKVISNRGFSKYFLTMKAISDKAQELSLVGTARGSAAGALTSYLLGITQVDPMKYDLLFERFLTRDGDGYPDIDYDTANPMRLKEALIEEWGRNCVVPISNFNTLKLRSLIKDLSKFYDIPFMEANAVTSVMLEEATSQAKAEHGIKAGVYVPTFEEVMKYSESLQNFLERYPLVETHVGTLHGSIRSVSRHAGGVVVGEDLNQYMPLINSGGVTQTPWSEGQNVRHLEPMGFIKFDILGLATVEMIQQCIVNIFKIHKGVKEPTIEQVRGFYDEHLHPDTVNLKDRDVWKNIFHDGRFVGVFQFTQEGAQDFCKRAKPNNIIDLSAITSIYRPGPLSADVDKNYIEAKKHPRSIKYVNDIVKKYTKETHGFLIFQEQIALLAHKLGDNLSLDEGNKLRKLLTKKGTGEVEEKKEKIYNKFTTGCLKKGLTEADAEKLWQTFEFFSGYGFNKSHAVSYCLISYQCAWLLNYYPAEWMAAFLDREPESRKEKAIALVRAQGYEIQDVHINRSGTTWEVGKEEKTLIQPLTSIKGLGEKAVEQILNNRPFNTLEELIFNENIVYSKLNKRSLDVLIRSQSVNHLVDDRFTGLNHFWASVVADRPKSKKKLAEYIETYRPEGDFSDEQKIDFLSALTGVFPIHLVVDDQLLRILDEHVVPPISEWDNELEVAWFIPRALKVKKTKNGNTYWVLEVTDSNFELIKIKCWGIDPARDQIFLNKPYLAKLKHEDVWGFSARAIGRNFKLIDC